MPEVYLSIGSNVDRDYHIPICLKELEAHFGPLVVSNIYESEAVGFQGDPFYNLVVGFRSEMPVQKLAASLAEIETLHGRNRDSKKFAPRTLDIDLILYGDLVVQEGRLALPRPEITEYAFMLEPLAEIAPDVVHPVLKETYASLWTAYDKSRAQQARITPSWQKQ
ncbi:MAG: folK-2 [Proteobacteria bacterium]|nr:folK-2 [Pseudomonadota bacterium]